MNFLKKIKTLVYSVIVPENEHLARLTRLDSASLRKILPPSREIGEKEVFPIFNYKNKDVRALLWAMKYKGHREIINQMAEFIYEEILEIAPEIMAFGGKNEIALVPIPMGNKSRRERGFNQTEELCRAICEKNGGKIKILDILEKKRETEHQAALKRKKRLLNMRDSMRVKKLPHIKNNYLFIIIDDVYTTGATIREARRALGESGFKNCIAITIAH